MQRDVTRLITAGTLTEDSLLDARRNNYLVAIVRARASAPDAPALFALARARYFDRRIPRDGVRPCSRSRAEIARIEPGEIIVSDALYGDADIAPYLRELPGDAARRATCSTARPPSGGSPLISRSRPRKPSARSRGWS